MFLTDLDLGTDLQETLGPDRACLPGGLFMFSHTIIVALQRCWL